jgi:hypothetical protein
MINHQRKLLFIHIARTGGTSIETALAGQDWWAIQPTTKHLSAKQARDYYGEEIWNSYTKFSVIRNPWDRIVSMWATGWWHKDNSHQDVSLFDFIRSLKPHDHERYNTLLYNEILNEDLDFILSFERLQVEFDAMLRAIGEQTIFLPHCQSRIRKPYRELFDEMTKKLVFEMFRDDIERFGFSF